MGAMSFPRWMRLALGALALGATYAAIYRLVVLGTTFGASAGATFWPASGVTVSVLILRRRREWPVFLAAIWLADFLMDTHGGGGYSARVSCGLATANCAEPLLAAALLRRYLGAPPDLSSMRDLGIFYLAAAGCGPLLSALIASGWQAILGANQVWPYLGRWYIGDALGVVVVAPALLSCARNRARPEPREAAALLALVFLTLIALRVPSLARDGLPFLVIPGLSLVSIRGGARQAATAVVFVGLIVEVLTAVNSGPFAGGDAFVGLVSAQMYVVACSVSALTASALMSGLLSRELMAQHDSLTGLANRRLLLSRTSVSLHGLARQRGVLALVFIDLDGFKAINDTHGHRIGDHVLVEVARRLRSVVRDHDTIARLGGDEFVILVDRPVEEAAVKTLVDRVERVITPPIEYEEVSVQVSASVGYTLSTEHHERPEDVLSRADDAMYRVKRARTVPTVIAVPD
jgi:diguanylate cyclase (GGDEF)-like protein